MDQNYWAKICGQQYPNYSDAFYNCVAAHSPTGVAAAYIDLF